ncbi:MAG: NAD-dependent epimerase/dehydratase [Bacteroidota bacterium]
MRVLITGGAGYIGTELTRKLAQNQAISEIIIYDNLSRKNYNLFISEKFPGKKIRFVYGDILDSYNLNKIVDGIDIVFHLAAKVSTPFAHEDPHMFEQVNHWGTAELSYILEQSNVSKLIYMSSISIYGARADTVNEDTAPDPKTYYGISKLNGEKMISRLNSQMKTYVLRCGNVYGYSKSMRFDAVINKFMFEAHFNNKISIQGSGKQQRTFIHVNKVTTTLSKLLDLDISSGTYNLADKNFSILELAHIMKKIYPELEMIFILQNLNLKNIKVDTNTKLSSYNLYKTTDIQDELTDFKNHFAFNPMVLPQV